MVSTYRTLFLSGIALLGCAFMLAGCSSLQVPKFDPQGRNLFAPQGAKTELSNPFSDGGGIGLPSWPRSAFTTPEDPPECRPETLASGVPGYSIPSSGKPGAIHIFPSRMAAPIGMEAILRGALYGEDGRFLGGRLLEWSLEEAGNGQFTDIGGGNPSGLERIIPGDFFSSQPSIQTKRLASSRSSSRSERVTRGTRDPGDDVQIEQGQTWVAITSDTPGITRLSLAASTVSDWDQQPAICTIHWLDVRWHFPLPQIAELGENASLETRLTTATSTNPLPGWSIRYSVEQGNPARLGPDLLQSVEVPTDAMGMATITVDAGNDLAGEVRVLTEIIAPGNLLAGDDIVMARGWTPIRWDGVALTLSLDTPEQVAVDQPFSLRASIANTGTRPARNVVITEDLLPASMRILASQPAPDATSTARQWKLGEIPAGESRNLSFDAIIDTEGDLQYQLKAESRYHTGQVTKTIRAVHFPLDVLILGPAEVNVQEAIPVRLRLTNSSTSELTGIQLSEQLPAGLHHVDPGLEDEPAATTLDFLISSIQPGETVEKQLTLRASVAGELCHVLTVQLPDGLRSQTRSCLHASEKPLPPDLQLQLLGPDRVTSGNPASYQVRVSHQGNEVIEGITLQFELPESLVLQQASEGHQRQQENTVSLEITRLAPGEQAVLEIRVIAPREAALAPLAASLLVDSRLVDSRLIQVLALSAQPLSSEPGNPDRMGLTVSIADLNDPVAIGQKITYLINIRNDRDVSDKHIRIRIQVPEGLELVKFTQPHQGEARIDAAKRTIQATEIKELLPREQLKPIRVEVVARRSGQFLLQVRVESARSDNPQQVEAETTVTGE